MPSCVVKCCKNNTKLNKKSQGISFHTFPKNIIIRDEWVAAIKMSRNEPQWQPSSSSVVCSDHFDFTDMYDTKCGLCRITRTGYPKKVKRKGTEPAFYVVQFIELPFQSIDNYVCVPNTWLAERTELNQVVAVAYPKNETPFNTRNRVQKKEKKSAKWRYFKAVVKYVSDHYMDAEHWIVTKPDFGSLKASSIQITSNIQQPRTDDVSKNKPTSSHLLNTPKIKTCQMSAQLYSHDPNYHTISRRSMPSIEQTSTNLSNLLCQTSKFPQERKSQLNQQNSQRPLQRPKYHIDVSFKPKHTRQPTLQGVTKKTQSPLFKASTAKLSNSIRQELSNTRNKYLLNEQQSQANQSERAHVNTNHVHVKDNTCQRNEWRVEKTLLPHHGVNSDSNSATHHEVTTNAETPTDNDIETRNNVNCSRIYYGSSCPDRPIAAQTSTSTDCQTIPEPVLKLQVLENCSALVTQMGAGLSDTCDMLSNCRSSLIASVQTYKKLYGIFEQFNAQCPMKRH